LQILSDLKVLEIGQMKRLNNISNFLDAPYIELIILHKKINITDNDIKKINSHKKITEFSWNFMDVPDKIYTPTMDKLRLQNSQNFISPGKRFLDRY